MIATKKQAFVKEKISESIGKPKELWEPFKYLDTADKTLISNFNAMKESDSLTYDPRSISTVFKNFFWSLAESPPIKLPNSPDKYNLESVINYYSSFTIADNFCLNIKPSENKALKVIKEIEISKAASMNKLSGKFLLDAAEILSSPFCEM